MANKPHGCDKCGMRFKHTALLEQHKVDHAGKQYLYVKVMQLFIFSVTRDDPRKRSCVVCGKEFSNRKSLGTHIKLAHLGENACVILKIRYLCIYF